MSIRNQILETLRTHERAIAGYGVAHLAVFGSAMRNESRADSDVDILVEFSEAATASGYFDRFMGLAFFLEDLLGRRVDLVTTEMLNGRRGQILRPHVEQDLVRVT